MQDRLKDSVPDGLVENREQDSWSPQLKVWHQSMADKSITLQSSEKFPLERKRSGRITRMKRSLPSITESADDDPEREVFTGDVGGLFNYDLVDCKLYLGTFSQVFNVGGGRALKIVCLNELNSDKRLISLR